MSEETPNSPSTKRPKVGDGPSQDEMQGEGVAALEKDDAGNSTEDPPLTLPAAPEAAFGHMDRTNLRFVLKTLNEEFSRGNERFAMAKEELMARGSEFRNQYNELGMRVKWMNDFLSDLIDHPDSPETQIRKTVDWLMDDIPGERGHISQDNLDLFSELMLEGDYGDSTLERDNPLLPSLEDMKKPELIDLRRNLWVQFSENSARFRSRTVESRRRNYDFKNELTELDINNTAMASFLSGVQRDAQSALHEDSMMK